jgi:hypothetical protein
MRRRPGRDGARWLLLVALAAAGCGGKGVKPLDPKDMTLSPETRGWVADAEDGVIAARARRDWNRLNLKQMEAWRDRMDEQVRWKKVGGVDLSAAGRAFMAARIELARRQLDHAEAALRFAKAKYKLINAERAVLHDLARYNLDPLQRRAQAEADAVKKTREAEWGQREAVQAATSNFWKSYGAYVAAGGNTISFWIGQARPIDVQAEAEKAKQKAEKKKQEKEAKKKDEVPAAAGPTPDWMK